MTVKHSTPITASRDHDWEWDGSLRVNHEFYCTKCGTTEDADRFLQDDYVDVADCPVLYAPPTFFKKPFKWALVLAAIELFILSWF